jgi:putative sterol carrier protein
LQKVAAGAPAEFYFEGPYDAWCKVQKGEVDIQSAVLKGQLKFKGSITKVMMYRDKLNRVADVMKGVPAEL